jgi:CRP-like cAMP-binding protein
MSDPNFDFFKSKFKISKETYLALGGLSKRRRLKAGETLVEQGRKSTKVAFLTSGLMRAYTTLESGKELTKNIFTPISFVGAFSSIVLDKPSAFCYEALTDSVLFEVDFKAFNHTVKEDIDISNLYNRILEYVFIVYENKQIETMTLNAKERYLKLKSKIPNIDALIPQYQIASYLNVSPVQLSRIRKSLSRN